MKASKIENAEVIAMQIEDEIKSNPQGRYFHRLHLILLVTKGMTSQTVAQLFGEPLRNVQRWVKEFNEKGLESLKDHERPGRPTRLTKHQLGELKADIEKDPLQFGFTQGFWDGPILADHIQRKYELLISVRQCQRIFHKFGYSLMRPQTVTAGSTNEAREGFKKT
jgi:transposase